MGYRIPEVDDLLIPDVRMLLRHWREFPPMHIVLGGLLSGAKETPAPDAMQSIVDVLNGARQSP